MRPDGSNPLAKRAPPVRNLTLPPGFLICLGTVSRKFAKLWRKKRGQQSF